MGAELESLADHLGSRHAGPGEILTVMHGLPDAVRALIAVVTRSGPDPGWMPSRATMTVLGEARDALSRMRAAAGGQKRLPAAA